MRSELPGRQQEQPPWAALEAAVRQIPVCVLWSKSWAGKLGDSILYRIRQVDSDRILVGYFAYWTTERPWGDNDLTRWWVPALAIDGFYSHFLFLFPGLQRVLYGAGDVEGARVTYRRLGNGRLVPVGIVADNPSHREVSIDLQEAVDEHGRILLYDDAWSHQLGGDDALARFRDGASHRCYERNSLLPLTPSVIRAFRLGSPASPRRARPAWGL